MVYSRSILVVQVNCKGFWWYVACFYSPYRTVNKGEPASIRNVQNIIMIGRVNISAHTQPSTTGVQCLVYKTSTEGAKFDASCCDKSLK